MRSTRVQRIGLLGLAGLGLAAALSFGCTSEPDTSGLATEAPQNVELPNGLVQVADTIALGRPAVATRAADSGGWTSFDAAFWAPNPQEAFEGWVDQLQSLGWDRVDVTHWQPGTAKGDARVRVEPWAHASVDWSGDDGPYVRAQVVLWNADPDPMLLVSADSADDVLALQVGENVGPLDERNPANWGDPPPVFPGSEAESSGLAKRAGDILFEQDGATIHVPLDTVSVGPTLPDWWRPFGSFTVLKARDGQQAVQAMITEASGFVEGDPGRALSIGEPEVRTVDGVETLTAGWNLCCGGWGFDITGAKAPSDDAWTLYVTSTDD